MDTYYKLLTDDALSGICGGITLTTPGNVIVLPEGLDSAYYDHADMVGINNGTAPFFTDKGPVSAAP